MTGSVNMAISSTGPSSSSFHSGCAISELNIATAAKKTGYTLVRKLTFYFAIIRQSWLHVFKLSAYVELLRLSSAYVLKVTALPTSRGHT